VFDRFTYGKEKYIAYIRAALLRHIQKDNIVYHGLAGHFFLQDIPHVIKIRVIADLEDRVKEEMKREGISAEEARYILRKDDDERRKWGLQLYGRDTRDSSLYDLVVHIKTMRVADAVNLILDAAKMPCFQTKPESQKIIDDLTLAAEVNAALINEFPKSGVTAKNGAVFVNIEIPLSHQEKTTDAIKRIAENIDGVKEVNVTVTPLLEAD
jgi:hypothetical protein